MFVSGRSAARGCLALPQSRRWRASSKTLRRGWPLQVCRTPKWLYAGHGCRDHSATRTSACSARRRGRWESTRMGFQRQTRCSSSGRPTSFRERRCSSSWLGSAARHGGIFCAGSRQSRPDRGSSHGFRSSTTSLVGSAGTRRADRPSAAGRPVTGLRECFAMPWLSRRVRGWTLCRTSLNGSGPGALSVLQGFLAFLRSYVGETTTFGFTCGNAEPGTGLGTRRASRSRERSVMSCALEMRAAPW